MTGIESQPQEGPDGASDLDDNFIVQKVLEGETGLFEILMRRYNQRLFRAARSIVRDDDEAEDIVQDAYVRAFHHLDQFAGKAAFSTWLTRIAIYEAQARARRRRRWLPLEVDSDSSPFRGLPEPISRGPGPEADTYSLQLREVLRGAIDGLPPSHRTVFVLRTVEGLSTEATSQCLEISAENVRVRLHRARSLLRQDLEQRLGESAGEVYPFHLRRCDRIVEAVFKRIRPEDPVA